MSASLINGQGGVRRTYFEFFFLFFCFLFKLRRFVSMLHDEKKTFEMTKGCAG